MWFFAIYTNLACLLIHLSICCPRVTSCEVRKVPTNDDPQEDFTNNNFACVFFWSWLGLLKERRKMSKSHVQEWDLWHCSSGWSVEKDPILCTVFLRHFHDFVHPKVKKTKTSIKACQIFRQTLWPTTTIILWSPPPPPSFLASSFMVVPKSSWSRTVFYIHIVY